MYGSTMSRITHATLPTPDTSWRRNRSPNTVMRSQSHRTKMNIEKAFARKLANVNPPSNNIAVLPYSAIILPEGYHDPRVRGEARGSGSPTLPPRARTWTYAATSEQHRRGGGSRRPLRHHQNPPPKH